jgi:hypothetical protein
MLGCNHSVLAHDHWPPRRRTSAGLTPDFIAKGNDRHGRYESEPHGCQSYCIRGQCASAFDPDVGTRIAWSAPVPRGEREPPDPAGPTRCPIAQPAGPFSPVASWPPFVPAAAYPRWIALANDEIGIAPAHPPLPVCMYLPFHLAAGSQTSTLISESEVGRAITFTMQRAGMAIGGAFPVPLETVPAGSETAEVISTFANFRSVSFSQGSCAKNVCAKASQPNKARLLNIRMLCTVH